MDNDFQIENIKLQVKTIESQIDNIEMQIKTIGAIGIGTQIKNIGIQLLNLGIQAFNIGNQMPNIMEINESDKFEREIKSILEKLKDVSNPMNQINMMGMGGNDMGNNMMGMGGNDMGNNMMGIGGNDMGNNMMGMGINDMLNNMMRMDINNNFDGNQKRKINFIFQKTNGNKRNISFRYGKTVDQLLRKYLFEEGKAELIDKNNKISFLWNGKKIDFGIKTKIEDYFLENNEINIIVIII